jgi:hypothetical protein
MAKTRKPTPKVVLAAVLKEFNHRCAICGAGRPQIHHIDEDPSNNDLLNLIPLCPNCHLIDQHNPTIPMDAEKLRLFREYKDPAILKAQFHPLFIRMKFLNSIKDDSQKSDLTSRSDDLTDFVAHLEMGGYYSKRIAALVRFGSIGVVYGDDRDRVKEERLAREGREKLRSAKEQIYRLIIELLRFQKW